MLETLLGILERLGKMNTTQLMAVVSIAAMVLAAYAIHVLQQALG
jgi:hypothetical protein